MAEAGALLAAAMTTPLLRSRCSSELPSADTGPAEDASVSQVLRFAVGTAARATPPPRQNAGAPLAERLKGLPLQAPASGSGRGQVPHTEARRSVADGSSMSKHASSSGCGSVTRIL